MQPGIQIKDDQVIFTEFPAKKIGSALYCKSFTLNLKEIMIILISPRLALDDEELFILFIDYQLKKYPMPSEVLRSDHFHLIEKYFDLTPIHTEWHQFDYDDHDKCFDMILYPPQLYGENLFKNDYNQKIRKWLGGFLTKKFWGTYTDAVYNLAKTKKAL